MKIEDLEKLQTLGNATYYLNNVTRLFIEDNNNAGSYNKEVTSRLTDGLNHIQQLLDKEYQELLKED